MKSSHFTSLLILHVTCSSYEPRTKADIVFGVSGSLNWGMPKVGACAACQDHVGLAIFRGEAQPGTLSSAR